MRPLQHYLATFLDGLVAGCLLLFLAAVLGAFLYGIGSIVWWVFFT